MQISRFTGHFVLLAIVAVAATASAHSDAEKPRYVAAQGVDDGRCDDPENPCRSIAYALSQAGKGSQILVAAGEYEVSDANDIFYLVSGAVDIRGGFDADEGFRPADTALTTLLGVPREYRAQLASRGFHVLADTKSIRPDVAVETSKMLDVYAASKTSLPAAPCVGGQSSGLACLNTELLSRVAHSSVSASPSSAADVWGFTDLNSGREYVIIGYDIGTAVFDVSDPENPVEVGFIDGQRTSWRDIKVFQFFNANENRWNAYAYVVADSATNGLVVIDLTELPHRVFRSGAFTNQFLSAHNVFLTNVDFGTGLALDNATPSLIIAGANNDGGRFRSYSLDIPNIPNEVAVANGAGLYMHDATSLLVTDSRKDQCQNETAVYCELLFDFNEGSVVVWDITIQAAPIRLSETSYSAVGYTHSGWVSEDGQYLFVHDELDEGNTVANTTVRVFSLADATAPLFVNSWVSSNVTTDHNGFVRGNRYYMSNYKRGLTILDISNPGTPSEAGYLDSYSLSDGGSPFAGAWGAYPFFPSGSIVISDIGSGLHMIRDTSLDVVEGSFSFSQNAFGAVEGNDIVLTVQRNGGSSSAVSVDYALVPGTADSSDLSAITGTLSWANGDTGDKTINLSTLVDADAAGGLEHLLVKLVAPTGGATLSSPAIASAYISDGGASAVEFDRANIEISERGFGRAVIVVQRRDNATGAASADFAISGGDASIGSDFQGPATGTLNWADGDADPKFIEYSIVDDGSGEADEFFEISLVNPGGANLGATTVTRIALLDGVGSQQAPNAQAVGNASVQPGELVTLDGSGSNDPDGDTLGYQWTQVMGPQVALTDPDTAMTTFTAPNVNSDTLLRFELQVIDPFGLTDVSTASVTVVSGNGGGGFTPSGGGGGAVDYLLLLLLAGLVARQRLASRMGVAE